MNNSKSERIDKIISSQGKYSRKEVKKLISSHKVLLNGEIVKSSDVKVNVGNDEIVIEGIKLNVKRKIYLVLNKPQGYVSATTDKRDKTVLELVPEEFNKRNLFPAGRLDKNTTGLMIITDDGELAHNILSPKKHVKKSYKVTLDINATEDMIERFSNGIELSDGICKPAEMKIIDSNVVIVTLREGRYHQIKRMFGCCGAKVIELHRISIGNLSLPNDLKEGECRELTDKELLKLQEKE